MARAMSKKTKIKNWTLRGLDTFSNEFYPLKGEYTESGVYRAAERRLAKLEKTQPTQSSGGQDTEGIQDRVYIVRPDGTQFRYEPLMNNNAR